MRVRVPQLVYFSASFFSSTLLPLEVNVASESAAIVKPDLNSLYSSGNLALMEGQFEKALSDLNAAAKLAPNVADAFLTRGIVKEKLLQWDAAISDYDYALTLSAKNSFNPFARPDPTLLSNRANAETGKGDWQAALRDFELACSLSTTDFYAPYLGRALVFHQLDRKPEATAYFEALVAKYPDFADGLAALAVMKFEKGEVDQGVALYDRALKEDSRYQDINWVENTRRWPPSLISSLTDFRKEVLSGRTFD